MHYVISLYIMGEKKYIVKLKGFKSLKYLILKMDCENMCDLI